jgi:hypothetical protein
MCSSLEPHPLSGSARLHKITGFLHLPPGFCFNFYCLAGWTPRKANQSAESRCGAAVELWAGGQGQAGAAVEFRSKMVGSIFYPFFRHPITYNRGVEDPESQKNIKYQSQPQCPLSSSRAPRSPVSAAQPWVSVSQFLSPYAPPERPAASGGWWCSGGLGDGLGATGRGMGKLSSRCTR